MNTLVERITAWFYAQNLKNVFLRVEQASYLTASIVDHDATMIFWPLHLEQAQLVIFSIAGGRDAILYAESNRRISQRLGGATIDPLHLNLNCSTPYLDSALDSEDQWRDVNYLLRMCDAVSSGRLDLSGIAWAQRVVSCWGRLSIENEVVPLNGFNSRSIWLRKLLVYVPGITSFEYSFKAWT